MIVRDGVVKGVQFEGDISHTGFWQYLIKNEIDVSEKIKDKSVFELGYGDFYGMDEMGEYTYPV